MIGSRLPKLTVLLLAVGSVVITATRDAASASLQLDDVSGAQVMLPTRDSSARAIELPVLASSIHTYRAARGRSH